MEKKIELIIQNGKKALKMENFFLIEITSLLLMLGQKKKPYRSYKLPNNFESFNDLSSKEAANMDRRYMNKFIKPIVDYLCGENILEYQNFTELFKKYKLKSEDIIKFINSFEYFINSQRNQKKINWLKVREIRKSNFCEKNIIINRLVHEYHDDIYLFISNHFQLNYPNMQNFQKFKEDFEKKVEDLIKQSESKKLSLKSEQFSDPEPSENDIIEVKQTKEKVIYVTQQYVKKIIILK